MDRILPLAIVLHSILYQLCTVQRMHSSYVPSHIAYCTHIVHILYIYCTYVVHISYIYYTYIGHILCIECTTVISRRILRIFLRKWMFFLASTKKGGKIHIIHKTGSINKSTEQHTKIFLLFYLIFVSSWCIGIPSLL